MSPDGVPGQAGGAAQPQGQPKPAGPDAPAAAPQPEDGLFGGDGLRETEGSLPGSDAAASRAYREARSTFSLHGSSTYLSADRIGSVNFQLGQQPGVLAGPLPEGELVRLRDTFQEPPDYQDCKRALRDERLIVLCGRPGTGRTYTALSLLDDLTRGRVSRLDPASELEKLDREDVAEGHGYTLEPATGSPGELQLDRLRDLLHERRAYAVLLTAPEPGDALFARGRYHRTHQPPAAHLVRDAYVRNALADRPELAEAAATTALRHEVTDALGLGELRPVEAARFAKLLVQHVTGDLTEEQLLTSCRGFAAAQSAEWFTGGERAEALPGLRDSALRIALAVLGGASLSSVAEASELLAWELSVTSDPESAPGRPLFTDGRLGARLEAARATTASGTELLGDEEVPVRTVRFHGDRLAGAVLEHLWEHRHNVRGPVLRWMGSLCDDPRSPIWVRAAVAAGALCRLDCSHTIQELVQPMAAAEQIRRRLFAATALDLAATDPEVGPAVRSLVRHWARAGTAELRWTAATVVGRGQATGSIAEALELLGGTGTWRDGAVRDAASRSVVQLVGSSAEALPMQRIRGWLSDPRVPHQNLGLLSTVYLADTRMREVWNPAPELEHLGDWPLMIALAHAQPRYAAELAGLLWTALNTGRSYDWALGAVRDWLLDSAGQPWAEHLAAFLPLLVNRPDDENRLTTLIKDLTEDQDNPLAEDHARYLVAAVRGEGAR